MTNYKNILVVNTGSTSVKYKLFNHKGSEVFAENFDVRKPNDKKKEETFLRKIKSISKKDGLKVAFRVVHGGDIKGPVVLDKDVKKRIKEFVVFAPIHNKAFLKKMAKLKKFFPKDYDAGNFYALFDTDFHQTIPKEFYTCTIDPKIAAKYNIRRYGFHGNAVEAGIEEIKAGFEKRGTELPDKIVYAHLGGGSSLTAVKAGKSVANTMGLTPISGLMMTTRVGDVDSDLDKILAQKMGKSINVISDMLSKKSGFLGLTGTSDTQEIFEKAKTETENPTGEFEKEKLAFDIYLGQLARKIGAYATILGGLDAVVFSGGIGENNSYIRKRVTERLAFLGIDKSKILVAKADEEKLIFSKVKDL